MGRTFLLHAVLGIFLSVFAVFGEDSKVIACYFTNWAQYRTGVGTFKPEDVDTSLCTHLLYAFAKINTVQNTIEPIEWNYAALLHPGILELKRKKPELKLILSVGGATATEQGWIHASDPNNRDEFGRNVVNYIRQNQFEGVDIDWETPSATTTNNYINLMEALRSAIDAETLALGQQRLLLTTAVVVNKHKVNFFTPQKLARVVDYVFLMAYDFYGSWSTTIGHHSPLFLSSAEPTNSFYSQHQAVEFWREAGIPLTKMVLGLATYGRSMLMNGPSLHKPGDPYSGRLPRGAPYTNAQGIYAYYEACVLENEPGWTKVFMTESRVPYLYGTLNNELVWIGYEDKQSFAEKSIYAVSRGIAGLMIWTLDFDDFRGTVCGQNYTYPLLRAINKAVTETKKPTCLTDGLDCQAYGKKGVCVAGFCGCPRGELISTKKFCTDISPSDDHRPSTVLPDETTSHGSHAERYLTYSAWLIALCQFFIL